MYTLKHTLTILIYIYFIFLNIKGKVLNHPHYTLVANKGFEKLDYKIPNSHTNLKIE